MNTSSFYIFIRNIKLTFLVTLVFLFEVRGATEKFVLITSLYHEKKEQRIDEYKKCLLKNIGHPLIEEIVVFFDTKDPDTQNTLLSFIQTLPIHIEYIEGRPTFKSLFDYANLNYSGHKIIVSNADIYFNNTLYMIENFDLDRMLIALTRWDEDLSGGLKQFKQSLSQDVWIFKAPFIATNFPLFELGTWHCDATMSKVVFDAGYKIINPSNELQACHVHSSNIRNYTVPSKGMDFNVIMDVRLPICNINYFFRKPLSFNENIFNFCAKRDQKVRLLLTQEVKNIRDTVSCFFLSDTMSPDAIELPFDIAYTDIKKYIENYPILLFDTLHNQDKLVESKVFTVGWIGSLEYGICAYLLYPADQKDQ